MDSQKRETDLINMSEKLVSIIPLNHFESDIKKIRLNDKVHLRRMRKHDIVKIKDSFLTVRAVLGEVLKSANYLLEIKLEDEYSSTWTHGSSFVRDVVLALRLLKVGDVSVSCAFLMRAKDKALLSCTMPSIRSPIPLRPVNPYVLEKKEVADFKMLWKRVQKIAWKPYLYLPLSKFMEAYEKDTPDEKILDYTIALESLVFYKEDKPIHYTGNVIGIAIGMLLGENQNQRDQIKATLVEAYKVRNAKVHGNMEKLRSLLKNIERLGLESEEYLRSALRRFIEE
jgi:hypothetical protein